MFTHINFQSIGVFDQDRALAFYRDKLGLEVERDVPYEPGFRWIFLKLPVARTMLHFAQRASDARNDKPDLVLVTPDVDAACETLISRGVEIAKGPDDAPWNPGTRRAILYDTENNMILIQTI